MMALTSTFVVSETQRAAKGRRWTRALQRQIADVWRATLETDTILCRDHGMEAECEVIAISTAFAVTAVRVIDLEVLQAEHGDAYLAAKVTSDRGRVVDGLTLIRNAEIHLPVILDPDPAGVSSLFDGTRTTFRVLPRWKAYADLPAEVLANTKTARRCHRAYESHVAGNKLVETLLDALAWIIECDPNLGHRDTAGELTHFPLPAQVAQSYERRHPDGPSEADFDQALRAEAGKHPPLGRDRVIQYRLDDLDGSPIAYCGYGRGSYIHSPFTERATRIAEDIEAGFPYFFCNLDAPSSDWPVASLRQVTAVGGQLVADGVAVENLPFRTFADADDEELWRGWLDLVDSDAHYYVRQRKAAG